MRGGTGSAVDPVPVSRCLVFATHVDRRQLKRLPLRHQLDGRATIARLCLVAKAQTCPGQQLLQTVSQGIATRHRATAEPTVSDATAE